MHLALPLVALPLYAIGVPTVACTQANFHTSSTHTPAIDTLRVRSLSPLKIHVGSTTSVTKLIARSRSHGFPLSLRLDGLRPAGHSSQLHKHTRHPLERPLVLDGARASVFGRAFCLPASLSLGCAGLRWVGSSCPPPLRGRGRTAPPLRGGSLPSACSWTSSRLLRACVGVRSGAGVCGRLSTRIGF